MKISRDNQTILADAALRLLARGICAVSMFDKRVASDVTALGDGFSFSVYAGLGESAPAVSLMTENGRFIRVSVVDAKHADEDEDFVRAQILSAAQSNGSVVSGDSPPNVTIRFKDVTGLIPVITGRKSVENAFAQHRMLVWGSINQAVMLVRIISVTEAYLFPKLMIKKAMRRVPRKQAPSLFVYIMLLFFGVRKPPQIIATDLGEPLEADGEAISEKENETEERLEAVK